MEAMSHPRRAPRCRRRRVITRRRRRPGPAHDPVRRHRLALIARGRRARLAATVVVVFALAGVNVANHVLGWDTMWLGPVGAVALLGLRPVAGPDLAPARPRPAHPRARHPLGPRRHRRRRARLPRRHPAALDPHRLPRRALPPASGGCPAHGLRHDPGRHDPARGGRLPLRACGASSPGTPACGRCSLGSSLLFGLWHVFPAMASATGNAAIGSAVAGLGPVRQDRRRRRHGALHRPRRASSPASCAAAAAASSRASACTGRPTRSACSSASSPGGSPPEPRTGPGPPAQVGASSGCDTGAHGRLHDPPGAAGGLRAARRADRRRLPRRRAARLRRARTPTSRCCATSRRRAEHAEVLVAVDAPGHGARRRRLRRRSRARSPTSPRDGEAEFRTLAVAPAGRGRGVGTALVRECIDRARALGRRRVVLSTQPMMHAAHRVYERFGFTRAPERDWSPSRPRACSSTSSSSTAP